MQVLAVVMVMAGFTHLLVWLQLHCSVAQPILVPAGNQGKKSRLPVVIFCHGMWACRTSYTIACCDMASHGYSEQHHEPSYISLKWY